MHSSKSVDYSIHVSESIEQVKNNRFQNVHKSPHYAVYTASY